MLAPVIDVLAIAGEGDSDSIEARLDKARNEELRHECAVELQRGGNKGLSLQTLLSE
ncbi:MAG: hypothetical protein ACXV2A_04405 [Halobacteriota archaeon]